APERPLCSRTPARPPPGTAADRAADRRGLRLRRPGGAPRRRGRG
ncbi:MAG: hypothetical protein AVDCRST_MAG16-1434, partial [uncultured Frankineae bacterium]